MLGTSYIAGNAIFFEVYKHHHVQRNINIINFIISAIVVVVGECVIVILYFFIAVHMRLVEK